MEKIRTNKKEYIFTGLVFLLLILTIAVNINHSAMWGDEWTDYTFSRADIQSGELYNLMISTVLSPPLFYYVMHAWLSISTSVLWFRGFNILIGLISGIFLFAGIKRKCGPVYGYLSVIALSLCFQWVYCMQDGSEYGFMIFMLFGAFYFFLRSVEEYNYKYIIPFILFSVGGIWTHYGSVFVAIPLLLFFYGYCIFSKEIEKRKKIGITISYALSFIIFAIPLVKKYLLIQMAFNSLSSHIMKPKVSWFVESVFDFGRIVGFMFSVNDGEARHWPLGVVSIFLIFTCLYVLVKTKDMAARLSVLVLVLAYSMHFGLVKMQYYAMLHENMSSGFYSRYSYFYLPLLAFVFPIVIHEVMSMKGRINLAKYGFLVIGVWFVAVSIINLVPNWNKSYDNVYSKIWLENKGYEDPTLVYYCGWDGFNYYLPLEKDFKPEYLKSAAKVIEVNNEYPTLPDRFWLWRTNWDSDECNEVITRARDEGYYVYFIHDYGYDGQLAFCSRQKDDRFKEDAYAFSIEGWTEYEDRLEIDMYCDKLEQVLNNDNYYITYLVNDRFDINLRKERDIPNITKTGENRFRVVIDTSKYPYDHYRVTFKLNSKDGSTDDGRVILPNVSMNF